MKEKADIAGGLLSIGFTVTFALYLLHNNVPQSIACWTMWALLDIFLFVTCFVAGNKRPWLPLGCAIGASLVACILLSKNEWDWKWNTVETISAIGVLVALISRWKLGPKSAIVALVVAMVISSVQALCDAWCQNGQAGWWYWGGISFGCLLSSYGASAWTIEDRLFPVTGFVFSLCMTLVLIL